MDVGGFLDRVPLARRGQALGEMRAALLKGGPGYFYAAGVEDLLGETAKVYELSQALHNLPVDVKRCFAGQGGSSMLGVVYSGCDVGEHELAYDPATKATARAWDYSRVRFKEGEGQKVQASTGLASLDFEHVIDGLYERQNVVASALLGALAEALGLPASTFEDPFASGDMGTIRLIHYPGDHEVSLEDAGADVGISPHTDFEAFTLQHQDSPGLQVLARDFERLSDTGLPWIEAPLGNKDGGEYIVMIGDVLERYTNGLLQATPHRVVRTAHSRRSIIRFNAVSPDTVIEPLEPFITTDRPRAYTRCTMRQHMEMTMRNLELGLGSWDAATGTSRSARFVYEE